MQEISSVIPGILYIRKTKMTTIDMLLGLGVFRNLSKMNIKIFISRQGYCLLFIKVISITIKNGEHMLVKG